MSMKRIAWMGLAVWSTLAVGQSWDTSGNGQLNGNYYFREVIITSTEAASVYGNIVFMQKQLPPAFSNSEVSTITGVSPSL